MIKYTLNLMKQKLLLKKKAQSRRMKVLFLGTMSFVLFAATFTYVYLDIIKMQSVIETQRKHCERIDLLYQRYHAIKMIVDKEDIELLSMLSSQRIVWTKKLESMAYFLPEGYWITRFGYKDSAFSVSGYGYITEDQQQLITLDDYLTKLRADTNYADVFKITRLKSTSRDDEQGKMRINFDFVSFKSGAFTQ